jgi:hypothetical protein
MRLVGGLIILLFVTAPLRAVAAPLFEDLSIIEARLSGPFDTLMEDKQSSEYHPFELQVGEKTLAIEVRLRGNSRRRVCEFPPLRLKFDPESTEGSVFAGQDKLKLVTHCRNQDRGEQDALEEFLAYRILNVLTDYSLRVRGVKWQYHDTEGKLSDKASPRFGFLLESPSEFAQRTGTKAVTLPGVPVGGYDLEYASLVYVFQYLVGNTDWSMTRAEYDVGCCHNLELFERDGQILIVPYDFDLVGLVDARYAFPDSTLRIKRVTQRLYRGVCEDPEAMRETLRTVNDKRKQVLGLVDELPGLEDRSRKKARDYLLGFFEMSEDELIRNFERHCL